MQTRRLRYGTAALARQEETSRSLSKKRPEQKQPEQKRPEKKRAEQKRAPSISPPTNGAAAPRHAAGNPHRGTGAPPLPRRQASASRSVSDPFGAVPASKASHRDTSATKAHPATERSNVRRSDRSHRAPEPSRNWVESRSPRVRPVFDAEAARAANPHFARLGVRAECLAPLAAQGITEPMPIQTGAIPPASAGRDIVAIAQTGTGKTLAFGLPLLARLAESETPHATALILTPTRELAQQIHDVLQPLAATLRLGATCVYGGVNLERQARDLRQGGGGVVIATPGRLLDHFARGNTRFANLVTLVLDEADRMLDMGFLPDIRRILGQLPEKRQTLMFSATFPTEIASLTSDMQTDPLRLEIAPSATPSESVRQSVYTLDHESKFELLTQLLGSGDIRSAIIFVRTKRRADRVARALGREGLRADSIHGDRSQNQRQNAIDAFARGTYKFLVATDVAARGIDITGVSHVINFDMPGTSDDYVHRIGRTARAHAEGDAITFVCSPDAPILYSIEKALGRLLDRIEWTGSVSLPPPRGLHAANAASGGHQGYPPLGGGRQTRAGQPRRPYGKSANGKSNGAGGGHAWNPRKKHRPASVS